jgi:hypothetical protein
VRGVRPALACKGQVILAIGTHDNPGDTGALDPLLGKARAVLAAAGISSPIRKALWDSGYASDANFTAGCEAELYVAIIRESRQTGRSTEGYAPAAMMQSWEQMAVRLDTPEGRALYKQRAGIIEPVFAQLFARLGRHLNYRGDKTDLELHLWGAQPQPAQGHRRPPAGDSLTGPISTTRPPRRDHPQPAAASPACCPARISCTFVQLRTCWKPPDERSARVLRRAWHGVLP